MNWYKNHISKIAQRMFNFMKLDEYIATSFINDYEQFLGNIKKFSKKWTVFRIGQRNIQKYLNEIFEVHKEPKQDYPNIVEFFIRNRSLENQPIQASIQRSNNKYILTVWVNDIKNILEKDQLMSDIGHELQHLLADVYSGKDQVNYKIDESITSNNNLLKHYSDPNEIRSYCFEIAQLMINNTKMAYDIKKMKMNSEDLYNYYVQNRNKYIRENTVSHVNLFILDVKRKFKWVMPNDLREQYIKATYRNFEKIYDNWLTEIKEI